MRFKFNKEIEYFIKNFFVSEKFLLKKRLKRAIIKDYDHSVGVLPFENICLLDPNGLIFPINNNSNDEKKKKNDKK